MIDLEHEPETLRRFTKEEELENQRLSFRVARQVLSDGGFESMTRRVRELSAFIPNLDYSETTAEDSTRISDMIQCMIGKADSVVNAANTLARE